MVINNDIITAFIYCDYKAYLKGQNLQCAKSEFEVITYKLKEIQKQKYSKNNSITKEFTNQPYDLKRNYQTGKIYINTLFNNNNINITLDGCYFNENKLFPILISSFEKITKTNKLIIGMQSHFIEKEFNLKIDSAIVVFGEQQKITKVKLATFSKEIKKTISLLIKTLENKIPPIFHKIPHCQICEFADSCFDKLKERDDLSLLTSLKPKEILQKNSRGLFSVKQLSYSFKPKKKSS